MRYFYSCPEDPGWIIERHSITLMGFPFNNRNGGRLISSESSDPFHGTDGIRCLLYRDRIRPPFGLFRIPLSDCARYASFSTLVLGCRHSHR